MTKDITPYSETINDEKDMKHAPSSIILMEERESICSIT